MVCIRYPFALLIIVMYIIVTLWNMESVVGWILCLWKDDQGRHA